MSSRVNFKAGLTLDSLSSDLSYKKDVMIKKVLAQYKLTKEEAEVRLPSLIPD
jgi:hypothetical protein